MSREKIIKNKTMAVESEPSLSATTKRLLGIRDFAPVSLEKKRQLLGSEERLAALAAIDTSTMPRRPKREMKHGIVLDVLQRRLLSSELLREHPLIYIGSGTDIEYPLALGGRQVIMVDTIFEDQTAIQDVVERVKKITSEEVRKGSDGKLTFAFDFGDGKEGVIVTFVSKPYMPDDSANGYSIPESTGAIVLFASQGPSGLVHSDEHMKSKLTNGGIILEEADVLRMRANKEEKIRLGK